MDTNNPHLSKVDFDIIRYANTWEDADVLIASLAPSQGGKMISIASGGDNALAMLTLNPELLVAVDVSAPQLYITELKALAIKLLALEEFVKFVGYDECHRRIATYKSMRKQLSSDSCQYWDRHTQVIKSGIINGGKFEKYLKLFARKVLPFIHTKSEIQQVFAVKDALAQQQFYDTIWANNRWQTLFKVFFSRAVMGRLGRHPNFFKEVNGEVSDILYGRAKQCIESIGAQQNHILHYCFTGTFGHLRPFYLQPDHYRVIKQNLGALQIKKGYLETVVSQYEKFDAFNLSNMFEYMSAATFSEVANVICNHGNANALVSYWNLFVHRQLSSIKPDCFQYLKSTSIALSKRDVGFFYENFLVEQLH